MDTDAYSAYRGAKWNRLDELAGRRSLTGEEIDELAQLYHATSRDLSLIRTAAPDPSVISRLSISVARARARLTGSENFSLAGIAKFFIVTLPLAFYRVRYQTLAAGLLFVLVAVAYGYAFYHSPAMQAQVGTPSQLRQYAEEAFVAYYTNYPAPDFAAQVWTNNAWIAALVVGSGITGVLPAYVMYANATGVGQAGAVMAMHDHLDVFFYSILPHGLLELTAIFIAAGAAFKLFWAWVSPGNRTRATALAEDGRTLAIVAAGLVIVLGVSGLVEGFVTGSELPTPVKIAIGALALAAYWAYTLYFGARARRLGFDGDLADDDAGYRQLEGALR